MVDAVIANTECKPAQVSADAGHCSEANIQAMDDRQIAAFIATGRQKHGHAAPDGDEARRKGPKVEAMRERLRADGFASPYRLRKQTVEPVFGQIKQARGFRQFLMRGLDKVSGGRPETRRTDPAVARPTPSLIELLVGAIISAKT